LFLKNYPGLGREVFVLPLTPFNYPLIYYFTYHKLPLSYLAHFSDIAKLLKKEGRIILVIDKSRPLVRFFKKMKQEGFDIKKYQINYQLKLIKSFEEVNLFLFEPKKPAK